MGLGHKRLRVGSIAGCECILDPKCPLKTLVRPRSSLVRGGFGLPLIVGNLRGCDYCAAFWDGFEHCCLGFGFGGD
jgi:hypothetical protein